MYEAAAASATKKSPSGISPPTPSNPTTDDRGRQHLWKEGAVLLIPDDANQSRKNQGEFVRMPFPALTHEGQLAWRPQVCSARTRPSGEERESTAELGSWLYNLAVCPGLRTRRLSGHGSRTQPLRGMRDPPRPGHEPVSPASAGGLSTTAPPGKPHSFARASCEHPESTSAEVTGSLWSRNPMPCVSFITSLPCKPTIL
ncbi:uncharacterized protein LOC132492812 isoform X1 [Mesoplodon densirostris]|uniref:uncharacterized protein LOC132492812 isoform X1 n=1 Tax=Mesoplodon densirostris TaxID=48708 RepID=UPI0028DC35C7|nr:uncharacterized protein LOC132492812 isoform X1 [Mesoplodon densirostris]